MDPGLGLRPIREAVLASHPQRHQHVKRQRIGFIAHDRRRTGIRQFKQRLLALDLPGDVEPIARVEAKLNIIIR